jgi:hypothetical protein
MRKRRLVYFTVLKTCRFDELLSIYCLNVLVRRMYIVCAYHVNDDNNCITCINFHCSSSIFDKILINRTVSSAFFVVDSKRTFMCSRM